MNTTSFCKYNYKTALVSSVSAPASIYNTPSSDISFMITILISKYTVTSKLIEAIDPAIARV